METVEKEKLEWARTEPMEVVRNQLRMRAHGIDATMRSVPAGSPVKLPKELADTVNEIMKIWISRGGDPNAPDIKYIKRIVKRHLICCKAGKTILDKPNKACTALEQKVLFKIIRERRSIRSWTSKKVSRKLIEHVLDAGRWAPSSCNRQGSHYIVVDGKRELDFLSKQPGAGELKYAPVIILLGYDNRAVVAQEGVDLNAAASTQNILLAAHALGLGACWCFCYKCVVQKKEVRDYFNIPEPIILTSVLLMGWPADYPEPPARKPLKEMIHYGRF